MIVSCRQLCKTYAPPLAGFNRHFTRSSPKSLFSLTNINLNINAGETVGIIGLNGSGKSTLLKLLAGVTAPTSGEINITAPVTPLIELGAGFNPALTGRENIYLNASILGLSRSEIDNLIELIIDFAELEKYIDLPIKKYSSGMYLRLAFAIAAQVKPQLLLIDEILAVGDLNFQQKCLRRLRDLQSQGVTIIFVSHAINLVQAFCSRVIYLKNGQIKKDGPSVTTCDLYLQDLENEISPSSNISSTTTSLEPAFSDRLFSPTSITQVEDTFYLTDCWHHRVLYNPNLIDKISYWSSLSTNITTPHSLCSNGQVLVIEDSEHHCLHVFSTTTHTLLQVISLPGLRPHRLRYCPVNKLFFCLCAQSQTMVVLQLTSPQKLEIISHLQLPFLKKRYTRSFTIINNQFYFVAGSDLYQDDRSLPPTYQPQSAQINVATFTRNAFHLHHTFPVAPSLSNMNDIFFHANYFWITATPDRFIRTSDLTHLNPASPHPSLLEDLSQTFNLLGTPYYLSFIAGRLYVPEINAHSRLTSCRLLDQGEIVDIKHQYDFGPPTTTSLNRKSRAHFLL